MTSMNKRLAMESVLVTLLFIIGYAAWNVVQGMIMTMNYVPDLTNTASSGTPLQSKGAFGTIVRWDSSMIIVGIGAVILFGTAYYVIRSQFQQRKQRP